MDKAGGAGLPYLLNALSSTNPTVVRYAIHHLSERGKAAEPAIPRFISLVDHTDKYVRAASALVLKNFPDAGGSCVPALRRALSDSAPEVRQNAAFALGELGGVAKPAIPDLLQHINDPNSYCALLSSNAVARIDPSTLPRRGL